MHPNSELEHFTKYFYIYYIINVTYQCMFNYYFFALNITISHECLVIQLV